MKRRAALAVVVAVAGCRAIVARPLSTAPVNDCTEHACDLYGSAAAKCPDGFCEVTTAGGRPAYPFWIVVHVPVTSIFAPGTSYVFYSDDEVHGAPWFRRPPPIGVPTRCTAPKCLQLGNMSAVVGSYTVTRAAVHAVGYTTLDDAIDRAHDAGLPEKAALPVRVEYEPTANDQPLNVSQNSKFASLPLDLVFASSRLVPVIPGNDIPVRHSLALPAGRYLRRMYPQQPFDAYFPPAIGAYAPGNTDDFELPLPLDEVSSRVATITRADGLEGFRVWLADADRHRISVVRTLGAGTTQSVPLFTTGQTTPAGNIPQDTLAIVAPPESWTAVPTLVTSLFTGQGLKNIVYHQVPPPVTVNGVVATPSETGPLYGYAARLTFTSTSIVTRADPAATTPTPETDPLLQYTTSLSTDDRGRFATLLPPGEYDVEVEPALGTGQAQAKQSVVINRTVTALTLDTKPRPLVHGRAVLADGRPLASADIMALADQGVDNAGLTPRPGTAKTGSDGAFAVELDPGKYVLTVVPEAGTHFPRVVTFVTVGTQSSELPDIKVPLPSRLTFTIRDPSLTGNPIDHAIVSVLADMPGRQGPPIEVGSAMTDGDGQVEILLAEEPR